MLFKISFFIDLGYIFLFLENHSYLQRPNFILAAFAVLLAAAAGKIHSATAEMQPLGRLPGFLSYS